MLSVCCLTGGRAPNRVAAILTLLSHVADEIVVAVDDRHPDAAADIARYADRVVTFPHEEPSDRPIAWLFGLCRGDWILNIDDDEVPSAHLLAELPRLIAREDITHAWLARRWLYPETDTYLDEAPWNVDYQLRLVRSDARSLQFSADFHRPMVCHGPMRFIDESLWHLDTVVNPIERRRAKAFAYERARRGLRIAGVSHNSGFYLPELRPNAQTAVVPPDDAALVDAVLAGHALPRGRRATVEAATREDVDAAWPGTPFPAALHGAALWIEHAPRTMVAGVRQTIDVRVRNDSDETWRWGASAEPKLRLGYHWVASDDEGLRTTLPADLAAGSTMLVPLHVLPPDTPGDHVLEVDVVHEDVRWLGLDVRVPVTVLARRRVVIAGDSDRVDDLLDRLIELPEVEPELLRSDRLEGSPSDLPCIPGLRSHVFGNDPGLAIDLGVFVRTARLLLAGLAVRRGDDDVSRFADGIAGADALVLAGADWTGDAPPTRELWRLAVTVVAARKLGVPAVSVAALPPSRGVLDGALRRLVERLAPPRAPDELVALLAGGQWERAGLPSGVGRFGRDATELRTAVEGDRPLVRLRD